MAKLIGARRRLQLDPTRPEALPVYMKVLIAMGEAADWSVNRVPYEEIVLHAWKLFPESFSLRNHPEHPDASDVHKRIYENLKPAGLALPLGNKIFRLTEDGLREARAAQERLGMRTPVATEKVERLDRAEQDFVERALASPSFEAWRAGRGAELIDYDARSFFEFTTGTETAERARRVRKGLKALERAARIGIVGAQDALELGNALATRFERLWKEV